MTTYIRDEHGGYVAARQREPEEGEVRFIGKR